MDKRHLTERDICSKFIAPALRNAGWDEMLQIREEARLNAPDPETFHDDAPFALDALRALTTRSDQIKYLRQTILNLAMRGKLVPQDPANERASELLERIANEKGRSRYPAVAIEPEGEPYHLPLTWKWAALGQLIVSGPQNGPSPRPTNRDDAPKAITLTLEIAAPHAAMLSSVAISIPWLPAVKRLHKIN